MRSTGVRNTKSTTHEHVSHFAFGKGSSLAEQPLGHFLPWVVSHYYARPDGKVLARAGARQQYATWLLGIVQNGAAVTAGHPFL